MHTHIYASCTSTYDNILLITNMFKLKMAKFVSTLQYVMNSPSIRGFVWYILANNLNFHSEVGHVYSGTFNKCKYMYMYDCIRPCTTYYDTMFNNLRQCSTIYANVCQKILPYDRIFVAPKSFTCKTFFKNLQHGLRKPKAPFTLAEILLATCWRRGGNR